MYKILKIEASNERVKFWLLTDVNISREKRNRFLLEERVIETKKIKKIICNKEKSTEDFQVTGYNIVNKSLSAQYQTLQNEVWSEPKYCLFSPIFLGKESKIVNEKEDLIPFIMNQVPSGYQSRKNYFRGESRSDWNDTVPCMDLNCLEDIQIYDYISYLKIHKKLQYPLPTLLRESSYRGQESFFIEKYMHKVECKKNNTEIIADMQHFGMPTRLLDVTTNFLIALYFSVKDLNFKNHDGVVYVYSRDFKSELPPSEEKLFVNFIINMSFIDDIFSFTDLLKKLIDDYKRLPYTTNPVGSDYEFKSEEIFPILKEQRNFAARDYLKNLVTDELSILYKIYYKMSILSDTFLLDIPPYLNERIKNQSGKFLLFGDKYISDSHIFSLKPFYRRNSKQRALYSIIIPAEYKEEILYNLITNFAISEDLIYQGKEYIAKSILTNFKLKIDN